MGVQGGEILIGCAEIAVAFAVFTSIVALFQHRDPERWPAFLVVRLRTMVEVSPAAMLFALVPFLPHYAGLPTSATWRVSSAALLLGLGLDAVVLPGAAP
jgi:hypothetical protein